VTCALQGGAESYNNVKNLHDMVGDSMRSDAAMKVSFGMGAHNWTNIADGALLQRMRPEIKSFGSVLRWIHRLEPITAFIPIDPLLKLLAFSPEFRHRLVIPLVALFFGTGNRTSNVSAALIARVFHDPRLRLFDYDPDRLLSQTPKMFAFSPLQEIYALIAAFIRNASPQHRILCGARAVAVDRSSGQGATVSWVVDGKTRTEHFDHVTCSTGLWRARWPLMCAAGCVGVRRGIQFEAAGPRRHVLRAARARGCALLQRRDIHAHGRWVHAAALLHEPCPRGGAAHVLHKVVRD